MLIVADSIGVPFLFFWLVSSFKHHGKMGDKVVQDALGWMCK